MLPTRPSNFVTRFHPGQPLHVPGIGWLPGPPHSLVPMTGSTLYVVDDAHAGEVHAHGDKTIHLISTGLALSWMASAAGQSSPALPADAAGAPPARWLSKTAAAAALGISAWTLEEVRKQAPLDLPGAPHPGGAGKRRIQWRYPADSDTLRAWWKAATAAADQTRAPKQPPVPRPPRRSKRAPPAGRRRSVLALLKDEPV